MKVDRSRGFTLIELLIVVVVIATLMGLVFRLAGVGSDQKARNVTITRMQKLEFALSGYYAAFGSYPPVPLHASRNVFLAVNKLGIQKGADKDKQDDLDWARVRAACMAQPVAVEFPYCNNQENRDTQDRRKQMINLYQQEAQRKGNSLDQRLVAWDGDMLSHPGHFNNLLQAGDKPDWQHVQVFKFGVLSFLLPRYLFMLDGKDELYDGNGAGAKQWQSQNDIASVFDFKDGRPLFKDWGTLKDESKIGDTGNNPNTDNKEYRIVINQPSQAVCARWMQALDGIIFGGKMFYGVDTSEDHERQTSFQIGSPETCAIYSPNKDSDNDNFSNLYKLDRMTVRDGWGHDLYYYSPPPYQGYRVWSGGVNGMTFPPWVDVSTLDSKQRKTAAEWMADDVVHLSGNSN